jgi:protein-S-isoprenylcysteine O-methyltransferase Ste14
MGRIRAAGEEAEMLALFGDPYVRYLHDSECFIPGIW